MYKFSKTGQPLLTKQYPQQIKEWLDKGIIEEVKEEKTEHETKELKQEPETKKRRPRVPRND